MRRSNSEESASYVFTPPTEGVYVVEVVPEGVEGLLMLFEDDYEYATSLLAVVQFSDLVWKKLRYAFKASTNLPFDEGIHLPNLSQCTSLKKMFWSCEAFNATLSEWDASRITNMAGMFGYCEGFNQPSENWNVSQVTNMGGMFLYCAFFNQPLEKWNVGNVNSQNSMFSSCTNFNQPLVKWDVSNVTRMSVMFTECTFLINP